MPLRISPAELSAILRLPDQGRLQYLVKRVADSEVIWSLKSKDGWVLMADDADREVVPVWPAEEFASSCCTGKWSDCQPHAIELERWLGAWTSGMERDNKAVAIFPTTQDKGLVVEPGIFAGMLRDEAEKY